jgi:hypothetical protein
MNTIGFGEIYEESWWGYINGPSDFGVDYIDEGQQEQWQYQYSLWEQETNTYSEL